MPKSRDINIAGSSKILCGNKEIIKTLNFSTDRKNLIRMPREKKFIPIRIKEGRQKISPPTIINKETNMLFKKILKTLN